MLTSLICFIFLYFSEIYIFFKTSKNVDNNQLKSHEQKEMQKIPCSVYRLTLHINGMFIKSLPDNNNNNNNNNNSANKCCSCGNILHIKSMSNTSNRNMPK